MIVAQTREGVAPTAPPSNLPPLDALRALARLRSDDRLHADLIRRRFARESAEVTRELRITLASKGHARRDLLAQRRAYLAEVFHHDAPEWWIDRDGLDAYADWLREGRL